MGPLLVPVAMPLESAFRGIVSTPATALATQLLPVALCNRLSWSVMAADVRLAVVLLVGLMMLLAGLLAGGLLEAGSRSIAGCLLAAGSSPPR